MMKKITPTALLFLTTLIFVGCPPETNLPPDSVDRWKRYTDEFDGLNDLVVQSNSPLSTITEAGGKAFFTSAERAGAYMVAENIAVGDSFKIRVDIEQATNDFCLTFGQITDATTPTPTHSSYVSFYIYRETNTVPYELWVQNKPGTPFEQRIPYASTVRDTCSLELFFDHNLVKFFYDSTQVWEMPRPAFSTFDFSITAYWTAQNGSARLERVTFLSTDSLDFSEPDTTEPPPITGEKRPVSVSWSANTEADLVWYRVYHTGYAAGAKKVLAPNTKAEIELVIGGYYDLYVTAGDTANNESGPSNVVSIKVEPPKTFFHFIRDWLMSDIGFEIKRSLATTDFLNPTHRSNEITWLYPAVEIVEVDKTVKF